MASELASVLADATSSTHVTLDESSELFFTLDLLFPAVSRDRYPGWEQESIDDFRLASVKKEDHRALEVLGVCIVIRDQTVTPIQMFLSAADDEALVGLRFRLGEPGAGALGISGPPCNSRSAMALLAGLDERASEVAWVYEAEI